MTFSSIQLCHSLGQSEKEGYLGLMTTFIVGIEKRYQFLHLSIQEFLAAWWITKYEKTEKVFGEYFDNDHFRMCLRFVAGLTHLEHESYQQYFNKELDLQCKRRPLFGFEKCYYSHFRQNSATVKPHLDFLLFNKYDDILVQLLYESQNIKLCQILSQSIKNHSLCLHRVKSSLFDILCLGFFLNNCNITWNYLDLGCLHEQRVQLLSHTLMNNIKSKRLEIKVEYLRQKCTKLLENLFPSLFSHHLQECYITIESSEEEHVSDNTLELLYLIKLQHLKILHFKTRYIGCNVSSYIQIDKTILSELEESLCINSTLQELVLNITNYKEIQSFYTDIADIINSVIKGVTRNKSIQTLLLECYCTFKPKWTDVSLRKSLCYKTVKHLLRDNHTLQTLKLNSNYNHVISSLDIAEVNAPLTALDIKSQRLYYQQTSLFPQHINGLDCLILDHKLYHLPLPLLFQNHPNLQQLEVSLDTAESVIELFTILQSNTTVKALKVETNIYDSMGPSLQDMLTLNRTIEYFEIVDMQTENFTTHTISSTYLSFLTTGLTHNTSVNELSVPIPLSSTNYVEMTALFNVISHKNNLIELKVAFTALNQSFVSRDLY